MPVQLMLLRSVVGLLCVAFAYFLGRSVVSKGRLQRRATAPASWAVRVFVAGLALTWRGGFDPLAIAFLTGAVMAVGIGIYLELRRKPPEDNLVKEMFPPEGED